MMRIAVTELPAATGLTRGQVDKMVVSGAIGVGHDGTVSLPDVFDTLTRIRAANSVHLTRGDSVNGRARRIIGADLRTARNAVNRLSRLLDLVEGVDHE